MTVVVVAAQAQPPAEPASADPNFIVQIWGTSEGLPANVILDIAQTPDGFLWIGTTHGLVKFDGLRFDSYLTRGPPHRRGTRVEDIDIDAAGNLWVVAEQKGLIAFQKGQMKEFHAGNPAIQFLTVSVSADPSGWIWFGDSRGNLAGISAQDTERIEQVDFKVAPNARLLRDGQGRVWSKSPRIIGGVSGGKWTAIVQMQSEIHAAAGARSGGLWLADGAALHRLTPDGEVEKVDDFPWASGLTRVVCLLEDDDGALWIGTSSRGLFRRVNGDIAQVLAAPRAINCLLQDLEGNLWAGTRGGGLARIQRRVFRMVNSHSGLRNEYINSVTEDSSGRVWLAAEEGGVGWVENGKWHPIEDAGDAWAGFTVFCLAGSLENRVWLATVRRGVWRWQDNQLTRTPLNPDLLNAAPRCIHEGQDGTLWLVLENALVSLAHDKSQRHGLHNGLGTRWVRTLAEDASGAMWAGDWQGGIWRYAGHGWKTIKPPASNAEAVRAMAFDGSDLWIATAGAGLLRVRGDAVARVGRAEGLPGEHIAQMLIHEDTLWFGTGQGLFHVKLKQLHETADGQRARVEPVRHGQGEGLPELHFTGRHQPRSWRTQRGELWFATANGALHFDPRDLRAEGPVLRALLEEVLVNGQPQSRESLQRLRSDARRVEFRFTAPSFAAPDHVRFRYQLTGVDNDWVEGGSARSATYASLPFGTHLFRVAACNSSGVWGPVAESTALVVTPYFWQTHWFIAAIAASFTGALVWAARRATLRRLRRKLHHVKQQHAVERERARISQDIHDELGASLTTIGLLADMGNRHKANPQALAQDLTQISDMARGTAAAMDAIVWALNPRNDSLDHFANYVGQFTKDFFRPTSIRTRLDVPANLPAQPMSANTRHNLFLAVKESLNNVVRHADATEVRLSLYVADSSLRLTVEDNGRGISESPAGEGQDGLENMRERIEKLSGTLLIETMPGTGTRISFTLPLTKLNTN